MKKVTLTVVVRDDEDASNVANMMENSIVAQQGLFVLACGTIEKLTGDEEEFILSELPDNIVKDLKEE
jgi:hypothetical protein